ncbi:MAG: relaxase/mobilization nuclease domain-containing protein [Muribaculaceae bacterium]|nr:relaxase/mobilization nuclease domain-containing protein [Muribaculaceae bacterium]
MAVSKLWPVTARLASVLDYATNPDKTDKTKSRYSYADYQALRDVLAYAKDEEKTEQEFFCEGINCNVETAREQFVNVKEQFGKSDGIQAYHGYLSFKEQDITPELAQRIGMEFAKEVWGKDYQVVVTTHLNTKHLHCHFVINSVSFKDGHRCHDETSWFKFRKVADRICEKYGLHIIENPERNPSPSYLTMKDKAGMPTRYNVLRAAIDEAIEHSSNKLQLEAALKDMGYTFNFNDRHKYWTIIPKGQTKPVRLYRLGEEYGRDKIMERVAANRGRVDMRPFQKERPKPRQYVLITREHRIRRKGGLYGQYLHYCYKLGYLPKYQKQNPARLHYLLRDDLMKLDELTAQTRLLGKHHIGTDQQLFSYQQSVEEEIKTLTADRTHLRNEIRNVGISDERLSAAKSEIAAISEKLKGLRKEVKLCEDIAQRSGVIREKLGQVIAEEEKLNGKERNHYDRQR